MNSRMYSLRKVSILLILSFLIFSPLEAKRVIKILAIGNSFSENAVEENLYQLAKDNGDSLVIGNAYIPGCSIDQHWNNAQNNNAAYQYRKIVGGVRSNVKQQTLLQCIQDEKWDYISFQQASYSSGKYETYSRLPALMQYVADNVTNPDVKYVFHMTWAYANNTKHANFKDYNSDQRYMYQSIVEAVRKVIPEMNEDIKNRNKIKFVIPVGIAIQKERATRIGDNLCVSDGYHLNSLGKYTAACVWLEMITDKQPVRNPYKPADISEKEAKIARQSAHYAVGKIKNI